MKNKLLYLSHILSQETIGFGGKNYFKRNYANSICNGNSSNSELWELNNHIGTHIDTPRHFYQEALSLDQISADFWTSQHAFLYIKDNAIPDEIISVGNWCECIPMNCEFLLLKTGFEKFRNENLYWENNPAISPDLGRWLKQNRKSLRMIGIDTISLTGFQHRVLGREAHKEFLGGDNPILIIEDMSLKNLLTSPKSIVALPLIVGESDASPCTVIAEV